MSTAVFCSVFARGRTEEGKTKQKIKDLMISILLLWCSYSSNLIIFSSYVVREEEHKILLYGALVYIIIFFSRLYIYADESPSVVYEKKKRRDWESDDVVFRSWSAWHGGVPVYTKLKALRCHRRSLPFREKTQNDWCEYQKECVCLLFLEKRMESEATSSTWKCD